MTDVVAALRAAGCVFAEEEAALLWAEPWSAPELAAAVARRAAGEPLERVLGWAELAGVRIALAPGVFVPRRRSELLVRAAVARTRPGSVVVDMCCGAGAVGAAVAAAVPGIELHAADIDPAAVACARRNVSTVHQGDLFAALPDVLRGRVDVLVCNAPYVPTGEIALLPAEARLHEPVITLDGGPDGVDLHRRVAAAAPGWLAPPGFLLIETSERQASLTAEACAGLRTTVVTDDDLGATVVVARLSAGRG